jgi:long-chain acyl-CoA synthetase
MVGRTKSSEVEAGRVVARLGRFIEIALADSDISLAQYRVLSWLESGPSGASTLASRVSISKPSVTSLIDGLVGRGLVERHEHYADRRRIELRLSPEGRAALQRADDAVEAELHELLSLLNAKDARAAIRALGLWEAALDLRRKARLESPEGAH